MWHVASKEYQKVPRSPKVSCGVRGGLYSFVLRLGEIGPPSARVVFFFFLFAASAAVSCCREREL